MDLTESDARRAQIEKTMEDLETELSGLPGGVDPGSAAGTPSSPSTTTEKGGTDPDAETKGKTVVLISRSETYTRMVEQRAGYVDFGRQLRRYLGDGQQPQSELPEWVRLGLYDLADDSEPGSDSEWSEYPDSGEGGAVCC